MSRRYGDVSREDIVSAAVAFAARHDLNELTMRALAAELDLPSMNLYHYVAHKAELLDLVADAVIGLIPDPPADAPWDEQLWSLFEAGWRLLVTHRGVADHLFRTQPGPNSQRMFQLATAILRDAGFDDDTVTRTPLVIAQLMVGSVGLETASATRAATRGAATRRQPRHSAADTFRFGFDALLRGLPAPDRHR